MVYRPIREKSPEVLCKLAKCLYENTGYEEISLISLSISDYSEIRELTNRLLEWTDDAHVGLSLPSLRIDSFSEQLMQKVSSVRASGVTFAPEAGTQRLRDVINKNITEEDLHNAAQMAFSGGYGTIKLYFMIGHPTETLEDLDGIAEIAKKIKNYKMPEFSIRLVFSMETYGLAAFANRHPSQLSGGMRQRVMIAMALACRPKILIADEPTTALDVTIQAQILELMTKLQKELGMAIILITHDLGVVRHIADRILVMNRGKIIEEGPCGQVLKAPREEYTRYLISSVPKIGKPLT